MKMELRDYYIERNYQIIKLFQQLRSDNMKAREATQQVATHFKVSYGTVNAVIYTENYAYAKEAWEKYNQENPTENE